MNTGSSVSKGTSNFFIHIVIGAMLVGTLRQSSHQKHTNCKPGFFYLNLCLLKHMINVQYYDLHADPSRFSQISQVCNFHTKSKFVIFPKDSDIQRNRKFGHGRECFAPPSPYLWGAPSTWFFYLLNLINNYS